MAVVFNLDETSVFAGVLLKNNAVEGKVEVRRFPDGETYVRIHTPVKNKKIYITCSLHRPDDKIIPLYFLAESLRSGGAASVCLITPYLPYLRHDKIFREGEALTSHQFARLLSSFVSSIVTVDPHLHRIKSLNDIYKIPVSALSSATFVAEWIMRHVTHPVLIGPDVESGQWVEKVASLCNAPCLILEKVRTGDEKVEITMPEAGNHNQKTAVILDDIISTGESMLKVIQLLRRMNYKEIICIGIHALFAGNAYDKLLSSDAKVITCNTVPHISNEISLESLLEQINPI